MSKLFSEPSAIRLEETLQELILAFNLKRAGVLEQYGVNETDVAIIRFLSDEDQKKMKEVGEHFGIKLSTLTSTVDKLEKNKLVKRRSSKEDRRVIFIQPTARGQSLLKDLSEPGRSLSELLEKELDAAEFGALIRHAERMLRYVQAEG
ncbi:MAG: MarR family transcriptional regulator [Bacteroidia bacterium]|nr:MarR family transcriptional regulator [Bacteroidia bacterium]